jgi:endogenous inhibitor of DNA gyrase (YacG/DUF329 family)
MRVTCPVCRQSATWEENRYRPFCSERCRMIDLGKWAADEYRIPTEEAPGVQAPPDPDGRTPDDARA